MAAAFTSASIVNVTPDKSLDEKIYRIKAEIETNGPIVAAFDVYSDFLAFNGQGTYEPKTDVIVSGHCVVLLGWGPDYWIVRNSWGTSWGLKSDPGCYHHKMGTCGIEDYAVAGTAKKL